ncbi:unnamed protein product [Knipowitschia caucasica]
MSGELSKDINIKEPQWDQGTFMGRAKHFFMVTDPRTVLLSSKALEEARVIVEDYRAGVVKPGLTEDELWKAKYVYDSAFHPDTGEKMFVIGRMSAQVPCNMTITGCMLTFYSCFFLVSLLSLSWWATVAQLVEQWHLGLKIVGSSPSRDLLHDSN